MADLSELPPTLEAVQDRQYEGACTHADPEQHFAPSCERGNSRADRESAPRAQKRRYRIHRAGPCDDIEGAP